MINKRIFLFIIIFIGLFVSGCNMKGTTKDPYQIVYQSEVIAEQNRSNIHADYTIAVVPKVVNIPYFNAVEKGVKEAGKDLDVRVIFEGPNIADSKQQIKIIQNLLDKEKLDVLALSANDPEALLPVLKKAREAGVKVITWDSDTVPEGRDFFVNMVNPEILGRHLMDTLAWNTEEKGDFAIMTGSRNASNLNEWLYWIQKQYEDFYPNMNLVAIKETNDDPHTAYIRAKELIATYPNLKGIIGNSSVGPPAAAEAVNELGKKGEIAVVGLSSPNPMNEYLKKDIAQIITLWSPKKLGYLTVSLSKNLADGNDPYDEQQIPGVGIIRMQNDMVIMGQPIDFTKENVDQYDF